MRHLNSLLNIPERASAATDIERENDQLPIKKKQKGLWSETVSEKEIPFEKELLIEKAVALTGHHLL